MIIWTPSLSQSGIALNTPGGHRGHGRETHRKGCRAGGQGPRLAGKTMSYVPGERQRARRTRWTVGRTCGGDESGHTHASLTESWPRACYTHFLSSRHACRSAGPGPPAPFQKYQVPCAMPPGFRQRWHGKPHALSHAGASAWRGP